MATVIGVRFKNAGKLYFFHPGALWPSAGDYVIVETARGVEFGEVVTGVREIDDDQIIAPLKQVIRIASADDIQHAQENEKNEREAYAVCQRKIAEHKLDMKLVSVEYTFDNSKILFYFTANGRVDFRSLVKDLASVFKTRIELRQIGVRDEAKMLGGLGPCGRPICCGSFLGDFQPVSIKMAKEQNLSLNPTKISGVCGRLMCCLKYEQDNYELTRKRMPKVGKEVIVPDGRGVVWDVNVIKETVRVRIQKGDSSELKDYPMESVQRVAQQGVPEANQAVSRDENESAPEIEVRPPRRERPAKPSVDAGNEKSPAAVSPWLAAVDHAMRAASSQDGDLPEELSDVDGGDEDFTLAEEEAEENPDDLLNFPDLMEEAPETGSEEDEQP
jgi:cell fate regulator YaaT (PSP1 superfamily)